MYFTVKICLEGKSQVSVLTSIKYKLKTKTKSKQKLWSSLGFRLYYGYFNISWTIRVLLLYLFLPLSLSLSLSHKFISSVNILEHKMFSFFLFSFFCPLFPYSYSPLFPEKKITVERCSRTWGAYS